MLVRALSPPSAPARSSPVAPPGTPADAAVPTDRVSLPEQAPTELTADEKLLVDQLRQRDREVRTHEAAHQAAGGTLTGGASFTFETGPDGRSYAVGGEVPISLAEGRTPQETIAIARQIRAAALAPADPSGQDLRVAQEASALELRATLDQLKQTTEKGKPDKPENRGTHLHSGEPCAACERATEQFSSPAAVDARSTGA